LIVWLALLLSQIKYIRQARSKMAPMTRKTTVPSIDNNSGAFRPKAIFSAMMSEGSSKPS
jgi:hypothetical protein